MSESAVPQTHAFMSGVEWPTDASQYDLTGKIGQGAFASVWRATTTVTLPNAGSGAQDGSENKQQQQECAIKVLNLDHVDSNLSEIRLEVQAMRLSSHPNVLSCFTAFVQATDLWLVTQLMRKGSSLHCIQGARRRLRKENKTIRMEDHILYIMHQTLLGLQYIHENGQIHRDIKAGNILLDANGDVRIADFGVSGWLVNAGTQQEKAKTFVGTPCWMAPEVMEQVHGYDYKADIWSLGITALELAKGYAPYAKYPPMKVLILTIQEDPPSLDTYDEEDDGEADDLMEYYDEDFTKSFRTFVDSCLQKNPAKRPSTSSLLESKPLSAYHEPEYRDRQRQSMADEVCSLVEDVGSADANAAARSAMPGHSPISIILSKEEDRPAGTTWVFADGSQVLSSSARAASVDDVLDEIDQFGIQTGGEHYSRDQQQQTQQLDEPLDSQKTQRTGHYQQQHEEDGDDLNAFMDEFELNTQGENFRR
ncbi:Ser/Thr protein kinase [Nitzschia inconspicua]|uniref:Ser/Thr protein kinase n=1 Tax=Nitzschia inconspicua TaxID=303405 RepID=A0A9K3PN46_9STRA|nr:Ser/Thr protein kinase [Nitzschia inconspicua]